MPEDAQLSLIFLNAAHGLQSVVDAQELMVPCKQLDQRPSGIIKEGEILHDIQQAALFAAAPNHGLERDRAFFILAANFLPLEKVFPTSRHAADPAFMTVREDDEGVVPEDLRNGVPIVA